MARPYAFHFQSHSRTLKKSEGDYYPPHEYSLVRFLLGEAAAEPYYREDWPNFGRPAWSVRVMMGDGTWPYDPTNIGHPRREGAYPDIPALSMRVLDPDDVAYSFSPKAAMALLGLRPDDIVKVPGYTYRPTLKGVLRETGLSPELDVLPMVTKDDYITDVPYSKRNGNPFMHEVYRKTPETLRNSKMGFAELIFWGGTIPQSLHHPDLPPMDQDWEGRRPMQTYLAYIELYRISIATGVPIPSMIRYAAHDIQRRMGTYLNISTIRNLTEQLPHLGVDLSRYTDSELIKLYEMSDTASTYEQDFILATGEFLSASRETLEMRREVGIKLKNSGPPRGVVGTTTPTEDSIQQQIREAIDRGDDAEAELLRSLLDDED